MMQHYYQPSKLLIALTFLLSACNTETVKDTSDATTQKNVASPPAGAGGNADGFLITDCLLPGQVRKVGGATYMTPRRPVKTNVADCEIRGGEYVSYDRANYATALNIWLKQAETGDAKAQTYVGEIYEKGLGVPPDYQKAKQWYEKAAAQGYQRAMINLGFLYEKGLGVKQDTAIAMDWYRKASGLANEDLPFAASVVVSSNDSQEVQSLRQQVGALQGELNVVRDKLLKTQQELEQAKQELQRHQSDLQSKQQEVEQVQQALASAKDDVQKQQLAQQLQQREAELQQQRQTVAQLEEKIRVQNGDLEKLKIQSSQASADTSQQTAEIADLRQQLQEAQRQLQEVQKQWSTAQTTAVDVGRLQGEVQQREEKIAQLQSQLQTLQQSSVASQQVANSAGPSIEVTEPPMVLTRGLIRVQVANDVPQRTVIGRIVAPAGLLSFAVNDRPEKVNENGVFNVNVPVAGAATPVAIVAVDKNSKRAELKFTLSQTDQPSKPNKALVSKDLFGAYHALIIGNNDYQSLPKLRTAIADAEAVEAVLKQRYGFKTTLLRNATRYDILEALNKLRQELKETDSLLIYYAGHGTLDEVNKRGQWLPVDATESSTTNWIATEQITDQLNIMSSKHILVVADSCYSGAMTRAALARLEAGMTDDKRQKWMETMLKAQSRTALTSGGLKPVLDAGGGQHSIFAKAFLDSLQKNAEILAGYDLYRLVSTLVNDAAGEENFEQMPEYAPLKHAGHDAGEFFFVPI